VAAVYGKDVFVAIERFGADRLPFFFALKSRVDALARRWRWLPIRWLTACCKRPARGSPALARPDAAMAR
jgi:hypothetical protein